MKSSLTTIYGGVTQGIHPPRPDVALKSVVHPEVLDGLILDPYRVIKPVDGTSILRRLTRSGDEVGVTELIKRIRLDTISHETYDILGDLADRLGLHLTREDLCCVFEDEKGNVQIGVCRFDQEYGGWIKLAFDIDDPRVYSENSVFIFRNQGALTL